jgi:hypothetical protein
MKTGRSEEDQTENGIELEAFGLYNQEFVELDVEEQERLTAYSESLQSVEKAKGRRILYQKAPRETLPFIVYSIFVSANAFSAIALMITVTGFLWQIAVLVGLAMVLPILALPAGSFTETVVWIRGLISFERG